MRQWTLREFNRVLNRNGFSVERYNGSHAIYTNDMGSHISVPRSMNAAIIKRLIKENKLQ